MILILADEVSAVDPQKRLSGFRPFGGNPKRFARNGAIKTDSALQDNIGANRVPLGT